MNKNRELSIEWMKAIATILIVNSHLGVCYGKYEALATGGAIGNALFFFCSGFALSLGRFDRFDNWMKRRIFRIYPSIISKALIGVLGITATSLLSGSFTGSYRGGGTIVSILIAGGGWFANAIVLFYTVDYILKKVFKNKLSIPLIGLFAVCFLSYLLLSRNEYVNLYAAESKFAWGVYFLVMLAGMCIGSNIKEGKILPNLKIRASIGLLLLSIFCYYGILFLARKLEYPRLEIISVLPLECMMVVFMLFFRRNGFTVLWNKKIGFIFRFLSSHCWEIYLAQLFFCFTYDNQFDKVFPFPLNIPMTFLAIFATGYIIKVGSRFIVQLFNKDDFDWKKIICTWN